MTKMPTTQEATADPTDELIALLVPRRQSRVRTVLVCGVVVATLAGFGVVRASGVVVPRLRVELQSSAVGRDGSVTAVVRVDNDGWTTATIDGLGTSRPGLLRPRTKTRLPLVIRA